MDIQKLMMQAQKMQKDMEKTQAALAEQEYVGTAGGSAVSITINGAMKVQSIQLEDDVLSDKEMLVDLLMIAMNSAIDQAEEDKNDKMGALTQGMKIPGVR